MKPILIAVKRSKWERDILHYGSEDAVKKVYSLQNHAFDRIYSSHQRQINARRKLTEALPSADTAFREELTGVDFSKYNLVLTLGGDNHFVHTSQYIKDVPIAGINSDPLTSSGVLLHFTLDTFLSQISEGLDFNSLEIESWTCIECEIHYPNGQTIHTGKAISEISVRNKFPEHMSRYLIYSDRNSPEEQKCSGLLLSTGTGSTGWFSNCVPDQRVESCSFEKDSEFFRYTAREKKSSHPFLMHYGEVKKGESLEMISEMDGVICLDSDMRRLYKFPPGCRAVFHQSDKKLPVVKKIKSEK